MQVNQLKAGVILSYVAMGLGFLVSLIYTPIMVRLLGQSEYGLYNLVNSVIAYLGILNFGFGSAYIRYYSRFKEKNDIDNITKLNSMFLIIFCLIGIIAFLAGVFLSFNTKALFGDKLTDAELYRAKMLMLVLALNLTISFPGIVFNSYITANEKFVFQKILQIIKIVLNPFFVIPLLLMGYGSIGLGFATTLLNLLIELSNIVFCAKRIKIKFSFKNFDFSLMKEMTVFSSFIFLYMVIDQINWNIDKYILGRLIGPYEVAIYSLGAQFNSYLILLGTAISSVFIPKVNTMVASDHTNDELTKLFIKLGRLQYIIVLFIILAFFTFGKNFIILLFGKSYAKSYYISLFLMVAMLFPLIQNIGIEIRKAKNKHKTPAVFMLFVAFLNILITIPLAQKIGAIGSAIGTMISVCVNQIFINIYYYKIIKINIKLFWVEISKLFFASCIPLSISLFLLYFKMFFGDLKFMLFSFPYAIVYIISFYFFGMNVYEKKLLFGKIKLFFGGE